MDAHGLAEWQGYLTHREVDFLKHLVSLLPENPVIVNIGAGAGTSTLCFLEARPDCTVISVDIEADKNELYTNEHIRLKDIYGEQIPPVIRVWGDSKIVGKLWRWPVDLVFVDGDHTEAGLKADIETWLPHIELGMIVFHDYTRQYWPDVKPTVDRMMDGREKVGWVDTTIAFWVNP